MRFAPALASFVLAVGLAFPALAIDPTISLQGHGEISAKPDTAMVNSGVTTQARTAREALDANTSAMADLVAALKAAGIEAKDIQTSGFSVNPQYVYPKPREDGSSLPPTISGYQVVNSVTVKVTKLDELGAILDKMVTVGANTINGIAFSVDDPAKLYDEARRQAFKDARHKADIYAEAAGIKLGPITAISEQIGYSEPRPYAMKAMVAEAAAPVPVEAGQVSYSVDVSVQWGIASSP